jgi:hypothetical protein
VATGGAKLRVTRRFRGATYRIVVHGSTEPGAGPARVTRLVVNGTPVEGNVAPLPSGPDVEIEVHAYPGSPAAIPA